MFDPNRLTNTSQNKHHNFSKKLESNFNRVFNKLL